MIVRDISSRPNDSSAPPRVVSLIIHESHQTKNAHGIREIAWTGFFACIILFIISLIQLQSQGLHLKKTIVSAANAGFEKILNGAIALQHTYFADAETLFAEAQEAFKNIEYDIWFAVPSPQLGLAAQDPLIEAAHALTKTGTYLSQAGSGFTQILKEIHELPKEMFSANRLVPGGARPSLTDKLSMHLPEIIKNAGHLRSAEESIRKIPFSFIPPQLRERFTFAKNSLTALTELFDGLETDLPAILKLLGDREPHTYLVLLQNNAELRPTGGFIGNFMIFETNDGYLTQSEVHDVYSADHRLNEVIAAPEEIAPVNARLFLRDSNYSGHFPLSAQKAAELLEKAQGPGVDTVIAIDQSFVSELLRMTGPITLSELNQPLTANNFSTVLSYLIEAKVFGRENPKALLQNFAPALQKKLLENIDPVSLLPLLRTSIESKHILMFSKDAEIQAFFERHGAAGLMPHTGQKDDFLAIVHTSIGGNKSDQYIAEKIVHDTYLNRDGTITNELEIRRTHLWDEPTETKLKSLIQSFGFHILPRELLEVLGRSRNLHMLRIYVPHGSILEESSDGMVQERLDPETGGTYFLAKMEVGVKDSRSLKIRYRLPFVLDLDPIDTYSLTVQKQAGQENITFVKRILPENALIHYKSFPEDKSSMDLDGVWNFNIALEKDIAIKSIWGK